MYLDKWRELEQVVVELFKPLRLDDLGAKGKQLEEGGREGGKEGGREGGREGGKEGERERGREKEGNSRVYYTESTYKYNATGRLCLQSTIIL